MWLYCNTSWAEQRWHAGKRLPHPEKGGSRILFKEACESDQCCVAAPRNTTRYTTRNTTRYTARNTTELLAGATFWSFHALKEWNENTSQFFCPDLKCCPWQHFGSVACSVACSVAWVLRVVCSVARVGCHVAHFASCSAVCRWRMKHTGGTMRRTDDGFDPLEVAGDGQKCEGPKIQEILFFLRWVEEILHHLYNLRFANA